MPRSARPDHAVAPLGWFSFIAIAALAVIACKESQAAVRADAAPLSAPAAKSAGVQPLVIPGDAAGWIVQGGPNTETLIIYLHGKCSTPPVDELKSWHAAASKLGTVVALWGDVACDVPNQRGWTTDVPVLQARIERAARAAAATRSGKLEQHEILLVGYSQGALRAEALVASNPAVYSRSLLIGGPELVVAANLKDAKAVATMAGDLDRQDLMKASSAALVAAGVRSRYFVLPGAEHGAYGPQGNRVMGEALSWLLTPPLAQ